MIVSNTPIPRAQRWLRASILLCAVGFLPLGVASVDAATSGEKPVTDRADETELVHVLAEVVAAGMMDGRLAFELYVGTLEPRMQELVAAGKTTPEAFKRKQGMAMRLAITKAKLKQAVAEGEMSAEDAERKLQGYRREMSGRGNDRVDWDAVQKRIEGAVERGDITREEASAKYTEIKKRLAARDGGDDQIKKRIIGTLMENGVARENIERVMGTLRPIIGEIQREGNAFELDPQVHEQLTDIGLTAKHVDFVVGLARRLAARDRGKESSNWDGFRRRIEYAVEHGEMTREEADAKYEAFKARLSDRGSDRVDWDGIKKRIEGAVDRGEMSRDEADAAYRRIKQRTAGRRDR